MKKIMAAICCLSLAGFLSSQAAVLTYGTFTGPNPDTSETKGTFDLLTGALAVGFTVNSAGYTLYDASFSLSRSGNSAARLRVFAGDPDSGGTLLYTTPSNVGLTIAPATVTFGGINLVLTQGQTYWLIIDANNGNGSTVVYSAAGNQQASGTANLSMVGYRVYDEALSPGVTTITDDLPNFTITVPEPHEYAMVAGLGLCAFALYRRRVLRQRLI